MIVHVQFPEHRYVLQYPDDITKESKFRRYNDLMYALLHTDDVECDVTISLTPNAKSESWDDLKIFLESNQDFWFESTKIGDLFWDGNGTSYIINDFGMVYNLPGINFPQIDNYVHQKTLNSFVDGSLYGLLIGSAYDRCFFINQKTVSLQELEFLLTQGKQ